MMMKKYSCHIFLHEDDPYIIWVGVLVTIKRANSYGKFLELLINGNSARNFVFHIDLLFISPKNGLYILYIQTTHWMSFCQKFQQKGSDSQVLSHTDTLSLTITSLPLSLVSSCLAFRIKIDCKAVFYSNISCIMNAYDFTSTHVFFQLYSIFV